MSGAETWTARALWFAAPRSAEIREELVPPPGPGEVRVRAIASAVSQGTERLVYRGEVPPDLPLDLPTLAGGFGFPIKYGYASVGRIADVGAGETTWRPGDPVFVHHPHQTAYVVPAAMPVALPPDLDPLLGVFTANLETAVNVLLDTPLHLGETAIVFGLGVVGQLVARLLRRAGAGRVVGVDPLAMRRDVAIRAGIDVALAPGPDLAEEIGALTDSRGADVAIEASGEEAALQDAIEVVADEGTVVVVSWYGVKPVALQLGGHFHRGRVRLRSSQVGRVNPELAPRWDRARRLAVVRDLLPRLRLADLVTRRVPFAEAPAVYRIFEQPASALQVVLTYDETAVGSRQSAVGGR